MQKRPLEKSPTSISYGKIQYEINFLTKRAETEKLTRHREKRQKNTSKPASFSDLIFFDFWYKKSTQNRPKNDEKSIQK